MEKSRHFSAPVDTTERMTAYGDHSIEPVSYTHLDVYKRQDHGLLQEFDSAIRTNLLATCIRPTVGRFVEANPLQSQVVTICVLKYAVEYRKRLYGKILRGRNAVQDLSLIHI